MIGRYFDQHIEKVAYLDDLLVCIFQSVLVKDRLACLQRNLTVLFRFHRKYKFTIY